MSQAEIMYAHYLNKARRTDMSEACATALALYLAKGVTPGSFLTAVLENNFARAVRCADDHNVLILDQYAAFLDWEIPASAWGSPEKVKKWSQKRLRDHDD